MKRRDARRLADSALRMDTIAAERYPRLRPKDGSPEAYARFQKSIPSHARRDRGDDPLTRAGRIVRAGRELRRREML